VIFKCPGSSTFKQPKPEDLSCPFCGAEIEIWSDEVEVVCKKCKKKIVREQAPSCVEWCKLAKECVGEELYNKFLKNKSISESVKSKKRGKENAKRKRKQK